MFELKQWWSDEAHKDFKKELKTLDEGLMVFRDKKENNWVIVRRDRYGRHHEIAHYEFLDGRVFKSLRGGDLRQKTPDQWEAMFREEERKAKEERYKKKHEENMEMGRRAYVDGGIREHKTQF